MLRQLVEHVWLWNALRCRGLIHQRLLFLKTLRLSVCANIQGANNAACQAKSIAAVRKFK